MTGLENRDKILVSIAHLCILIKIPGLFLAFSIFYLNNEKSQFFIRGVRQAIGLQLIVTAFSCIYYIMAMFGFVSRFDGRSFNSLQLGFSIMYVTVIIFAIYAASRAYKGVYYRYPIIGRFIEKH
jgi:uncharacterized Tic20 family protein